MKSTVLQVVLISALSFSALAADIDNTDVTLSSLVTQADKAKAWGLSENDWQRYEALMNSPSGHGLEKSNPITVLGRFARTATERQRLAEKLVMYEKKRVEGLLAFNVAYQSAWQRLYPNLKPVDANRPSRVALFVKDNCSSCFTAYQQWRSQGVGVDVYMTGTLGQDHLLKAWAEQAGITETDIKQKAVTLNHDAVGLAFSLSQGRPFPISAHKRGGQWSVIPSP